jgi:putative NADH-flavin reductase
MKIIVFGASGRTGRELVKQGLDLGHEVTAFVRNPAKLNIAHKNLNVIQGDVINYRDVDNAVKRNDAVISALGASSPFRYDQSIVDGLVNIIQALHANNISRLIYMSFVGVKQSRNQAGFVIKYIAPKLLATEIAGHEAREHLIRKSELNWTIVRPPTLTNGKGIGLYRAGEKLSTGGFTVTISRSDVADFMLSQLTDNSYLKKSPVVMY